MKKKHPLAIPLFIISLLLIIGAALAVLYALKNDTAFDMILLFIAAALMVFVGGIILYILILSVGKKQNFFLYDYKSKKEISVDELTFEMIEKRLDSYFGIVLSQINKQDGAFDRFIKAHFNAEMPEAYKPLLIPFIFWTGIKNSKASEWIGFLQADKDAIDLIENHLFEIGAFNISSKLQYYRTFEESRVDEINEFLKSKQAYLEETILRYIKDNIVMFQAIPDSKSNKMFFKGKHNKIKDALRHIHIGHEVIINGDPQEIIDPLLWTVSIYDGEEKYNDDLSKYSLPQRYIFAIQWYVAEVNNGGHSQFYFNSTGIVYPDALKGFKEIGHKRAYNLLNESINRVEKEIPLERSLR